MSVIEAVQNNGTTTSSKPSLARPPPRSVDFTYAQPTDKPRNLDDTLKSWDSVPLFMKQLPTESSRTDDESTQVALDALESLTFDGTSDEVALNFKSQANEYFKSKRYREALGFYSQAIQAQPVDKSLLETLYANRAACNLELQNYGATLRDTGKVIAMNPNNEKAYYRATKALIALDRFNDAQECAQHSLCINPCNLAIQALKVKAQEMGIKQTQMQTDKFQRKRNQESMQKALEQALILRGLWLETTCNPPDNPQPAHFDAESLSNQSSSSSLPSSETKWMSPDVIRTPLVLPVVFMYPQYAQSDFISDYHEDTPLSNYISTMFPKSNLGSLPWDQNREYFEGNLQVYAITRKQRLLKLGKKLCLRQVMDLAYKQADEKEDKVKGRDGLVMMDGILSLIILPKGQAEEVWVQKFKATREKQLKK